MRNLLLLILVIVLLAVLCMSFFVPKPVAEIKERQVANENAVSAPQLMLNIVNTLPALISKYLVK